MSHIEISRADPSQLADLAAVAEDAQGDPERFVAYFAAASADIVQEVSAIAGWPSMAHVARRGERLAGWILAEVDAELGRVWWWGPVVAIDQPWATIANALYSAASADLSEGVDQEELAADVRSLGFGAFADRHGFRPDPAAALMRLDLGDTEADPRVTIADRDDDREIGALHDRLFPGSHATGRQLVDDPTGLRLVSHEAGRVVGYLAAEVQADGDGYIDFVGVDPDRRGGGLGRALVETALDALGRRGASSVNLTVREDAAAARRLYRRLGFDELRVLRPYRKGFSLGA